MRSSVISRINIAAKNRDDIFLITGDAGFGVLDAYQKEFPGRFLNLGIAEQNTVSFASGLALTGYKVFIYNIVPFVLFRCFEQVRNDICYQNLPVTLIGIGSGVTYAPQGVTHYSVEDIAIARTLPNLVILSPGDPYEAELCAEYAINSKRPVYIRIAKSGEAKIHCRRPLSITKPITINKEGEVAVLFHGSVAIEAYNAVQELNKKIKLISVPMLNPVDFRALKQELRGAHTVVTVEEHFVDGGLGSIIAEWIIKEKTGLKLIKLGIRNEFIHAVKNNAGMRQEYGISAQAIKNILLKACRHA